MHDRAADLCVLVSELEGCGTAHLVPAHNYVLCVQFGVRREFENSFSKIRIRYPLNYDVELPNPFIQSGSPIVLDLTGLLVIDADVVLEALLALTIKLLDLAILQLGVAAGSIQVVGDEDHEAVAGEFVAHGLIMLP